MRQFNEFLATIDSYIGGSQWFVYLLLGTGLFFTIFLKFPQFRYLKYAVKIVMGKFDRPGDKGDASFSGTYCSFVRYGWNRKYCRCCLGCTFGRASRSFLDVNNSTRWDDDQIC